MIKRIIRIVIAAKENETIEDAIDRHLKHLSRVFYKQVISSEMLKNAFESCGLSHGDTVFVQASWRSMFNYKAKPETVIKILFDIVGETGTVLMPCYGESRTFFDVENTPSNAGVLSEVYRRMPGVQRSKCTHFSVAGKGPKAEYFLCDHINSEYGFDEHSPLFKICQEKNAKILFLGLGRTPTKISAFHCAGAYLRDHDEKIRKLLSKEYESILIADGVRMEKKMYIRIPGHQNNHRIIRRIFRSLKNKKTVRISNVDIVILQAKESFEKTLEFAKKGVYCYKNMWKL